MQDLLHHYPRRYNDFSRVETLAQAPLGQDATFLVTVRSIHGRRSLSGRQTSEATVADASGSARVMWFTPWPARQLQPGTQVALSGPLTLFNGQRRLDHPEYELADRELLNTGRLVPVYPSTEGLSQRTVRRAVRAILDAGLQDVHDPLPPAVRDRHGLPGIADALAGMHFPASAAEAERSRNRLAFDELLVLQLGLQQQRLAWQTTAIADPLPEAGRAVDDFAASLPFPLTGAQRRVLFEIAQDLQRPLAMSRLVQGEVGSGKTAVAAGALLAAVRSGAQGVMMAPTEILAHQHAQSLARLFAGLPSPPSIAVLTGSQKKRERTAILAAIASGTIDIVVGTHAVIQDTVEFDRLGVAIVDEQHRFGVLQRKTLRTKGPQPHVLVMTATPIPRTLALSLYGDLDLSLLDEMPPGRSPITTRWLQPQDRDQAYDHIRRELDAGHQAFVILPLVEESPALEARAATTEAERLTKEVFPDRRIGLLHGRMAGAAKDAAMAAFARHDTDILVATAVVEVGVDVPNATVMLIEDANRFGLAQLHQFRGRVGRGSAPGSCFLVAEASAESTIERLSAIERTTNGLELAEIDLRLRGPGDFLGTRQSGLPALRLASVTDLVLIQQTRDEAARLLEDDPGLRGDDLTPLRTAITALWERSVQERS